MDVEPILIKRYAEERLYNTHKTGADITLDYLKRLN
jgi:polyhydroxyalkanoate synthesis regulator protein